MTDTRGPGTRVVYRCHACSFEFGVATPGATPCPRCGAIGGHDRVGTTAVPESPGGDSDVS